MKNKHLPTHWRFACLKCKPDNKQLKQASYTVCNMCQGKSPLWRIDARKVNYDAKGQNINYNDAVLRVKNIPIFYVPFLSHPSPEVKRRSGILMTSMGSSAYLGKYIQPTYFIDVSDNTDVLLSPYFTEDGDVVFGGQYRQYFYNGHINAQGTYLKDKVETKDDSYYSKFKRPDNRGSLFLDARYEINDYWVSNLDLNYVSDVFYLRDLNLPDDDDAWLTSKLSFERFKGRDYAAIEGYYYKLTSYYLKAYNDSEFRNRAKRDKVDVSEDVVFEMELIKSIEVNIDYILGLVKKYHESNMEDKEILVTIQKTIMASPDLRNKKDLIMAFIESLDQNSDVYSDFESFMKLVV